MGQLLPMPTAPDPSATARQTHSLRRSSRRPDISSLKKSISASMGKTAALVHAALFLDTPKGSAQRKKKTFLPLHLLPMKQRNAFPQNLLNVGSNEHKKGGQGSCKTSSQNIAACKIVKPNIYQERDCRKQISSCILMKK